MKPLPAILPALLAIALSGSAASAEETIELGDAGIAYLAPDSRLEPSPNADDVWILAEGTVRIASAEPIGVAIGTETLEIEAGLVRLSVDGARPWVCADEGRISLADGFVREGACAELDETGLVPLEPGPAESTALQPAAIALDPPVVDEPRRAFDEALRLSGVDQRGEGGGGETLETGGTAACLDTSSGGAEASGPEGPELPESEIDRAWHRVRVEVTLEDY